MSPSKLIFNILPSIITGIAGVLWPKWIMDGVFDGEIIPAIGSFIAIYGGFVANIVWIYKTWKKNK
jgi:hypothetical protein